MKKKIKKAFTLVELLVVIAILAILATVSIVGYNSFTNKAKISVDQQAVAQMNTVLQADEVLNGVPESIDKVADLLIENGYSDKFQTYYSKHTIGWLKEKNSIVLIEDASKITYPESLSNYPVSNVITFTVNIVTDSKTLLDSLNSASSMAVGYTNIILSNDISLQERATFSVSDNMTVAIDLNGKSITSEHKTFRIDGNGRCDIKNGTIVAPQPETISESKDPSYCVGIFGNSTVTIENCNLIAGAYGIATNGSSSKGTKVIMKNCTVDSNVSFYSPAGEWNVENCTFKRTSVICGGNVTMNKCTFNCDPNRKAYTDEEIKNNYGRGDGAQDCGDALLVLNRRSSGYEFTSLKITNSTFNGNENLYSLRIIDMEAENATSAKIDIGSSNTFNGKK